MISFEDALYAELYDMPKWRPWHARLIGRIESHTEAGPAPLSQAIEARVRMHFGLCDVSPIDWGNLGSVKKADGTAIQLDWAAIIAFIEQILPALLAILFGGS